MQITMAMGSMRVRHVRCRPGIGWYQTDPGSWATGALCPDHLCLADLGVADTWRGRLVRALFWLLR